MILNQYLGDAKIHQVRLSWGGKGFLPDANWTLIFTAKTSPLTQSDAEAAFQKTTGGGGIVVSGAKASVSLLPQDTSALSSGTLYWDIQATNTSGDTRTVAEGTMMLRRDVTRESEPTLDVHTIAPPLLFFSYTSYLEATSDSPPMSEEEWVAAVASGGGAGIIGAVRYDTAQDLSPEEQEQARENIGAEITTEAVIAVLEREDGFYDQPGRIGERHLPALNGIGLGRVLVASATSTVVSDGGVLSGDGSSGYVTHLVSKFAQMIHMTITESYYTDVNIRDFPRLEEVVIDMDSPQEEGYFDLDSPVVWSLTLSLPYFLYFAPTFNTPNLVMLVLNAVTGTPMSQGHFETLLLALSESESKVPSGKTITYPSSYTLQGAGYTALLADGWSFIAD
jgi:hypothetical protein